MIFRWFKESALSQFVRSQLKFNRAQLDWNRQQVEINRNNAASIAILTQTLQMLAAKESPADERDRCDRPSSAA